MEMYGAGYGIECDEFNFRNGITGYFEQAD